MKCIKLFEELLEGDIVNVGDAKAVERLFSMTGSGIL